MLTLTHMSSALLAFRVSSPISVLLIGLLAGSLLFRSRDPVYPSSDRYDPTLDYDATEEEALPVSELNGHLPLAPPSKGTRSGPLPKKLAGVFFLLATFTYAFDSATFIFHALTDGTWESTCDANVSARSVCIWIVEEWNLVGSILANTLLAGLLLWESTQTPKTHLKANALASWFLRYYVVLAAVIGSSGELVILLLISLAIYRGRSI